MSDSIPDPTIEVVNSTPTDQTDDNTPDDPPDDVVAENEGLPRKKKSKRWKHPDDWVPPSGPADRRQRHRNENSNT